MRASPQPAFSSVLFYNMEMEMKLLFILLAGLFLYSLILSLLILRLAKRVKKNEALSLKQLASSEYGALLKMSEKYVQKVGIVRYNPYNDTGGDQSFAVALLDGKGDGIVLSSLHGRDTTRIFAKPVKDRKEDSHPLSEEEKEAIQKAFKE